MDEPLSNLDAKQRVTMRSEITDIHRKVGSTTIYVTHDQIEAMTMADRIVVMKDGFIQQVASPPDLYDYPTNMFVAGFIGSPQMNFIDSVIRKNDGKYFIEFGSERTKTSEGKKYLIEIPEAKNKNDIFAEYVDKEVVLGVRPEALNDDEMHISAAQTGVIDCNVEVTELMGAETYLYLNCEGYNLIARVSPRTPARAGDTIKVAIDVNRIHIFDKETEKTIAN
jgi:multiple sugar transport system ATP-binding protein